MTTTINIQNLKCSGCAATITKKIATISTVSDVKINVEESTVSFKCATEADVNEVKATLQKIGYPEVGAENSLGTKAKSYVSCAIGKINK